MIDVYTPNPEAVVAWVVCTLALAYGLWAHWRPER